VSSPESFRCLRYSHESHSLDDLANKIASATFNVIKEGKVRTADMGGSSTTSDFTGAVIKKL
jgi:isocitrate dehydrogenase (NAD+)